MTRDRDRAKEAIDALGRRLRDLEQQAADAAERADGLQRECDDARAAADRDRERADTAEAHLTAFTTALAAGNFRADPPGDPA